MFDSEPQTNVCGRSFAGVAIVVLNCDVTNALGERRTFAGTDPYLRAYIYSEQALGAVPAGTAARPPAWLSLGLSSYARLLYHASTGAEDYANTRTQALRAARRTALALREIDLALGEIDEDHESDEDEARDDGVSDLAFLAVEWLTGEADDDAIARYHHLLRTSTDWTRSFEAAFGMSIDDFHVSFEAYRTEHFAPDAHRAEDEANGPSLAFLGDVAADAREEVAAELKNVQAFFGERFEAELPAYTIYAGAAADAVREAFPGYSFNGWCGDRLWQAQTIIALNRCGEWRLDAFAAQALTGAQGSSPGPGPFPPWLYHGAERYATREYRIAAGRLDRDRHQAVLIAVVKYEEGSLQDGEDSSRTTGSVPQWLGELAVELLAERVGEPTVFRYFQDPIPSEDIWRERFEATFGVTVDAFYEEFEEQRSGLMLP